MRAAFIWGLLAAVVTAGCGAQPGGETGTDRPPGPPPVMPTWSSCAKQPPASSGPFLGVPAANDALSLPLLGDDFSPVSVVLCGSGPLLRRDGGTDEAATESRSDDVAALVATLRLPDQPSANGICTADLPAVPWLVLLDEQGRWVRPGIPRDACGKPRIEVRDAIAALSLRTTSSRPIRNIESAEAAAAGCGQAHADMVWVQTSIGSGDRTATIGDLLAGATQARLCVYEVPASEQRSVKPAGDFSYGGPLSGERWTAIERSILAAGPEQPCTTPAGRFALLQASTAAGGEVYVELDGCRRIMVSTNSGPPSLRQADPTLLTLLTDQ